MRVGYAKIIPGGIQQTVMEISLVASCNPRAHPGRPQDCLSARGKEVRQGQVHRSESPRLRPAPKRRNPVTTPPTCRSFSTWSSAKAETQKKAPSGFCTQHSVRVSTRPLRVPFSRAGEDLSRAAPLLACKQVAVSRWEAAVRFSEVAPAHGAQKLVSEAGQGNGVFAFPS